jgi:alpha-tubulin suppressor-like RCC1 family protein
MILNDEGDVFSWGDNDCGQLGHGEGQNQKTPKKIEDLSKIFISHIS